VSKLSTLLAIPVGLAITKAIVDRIQDEPSTKDVVPAAKPTTGKVVDLVPTPKATRAEPITPFKTLKERAEEAAFIARQQKLTREQLLGRFGL
jgi:hypothetical protein